MDFNLNNFSSNLMLIALVLVGLCCLYLLYSNFTKVREIEELKRRVEDLKKIFLNQQIHNDETFSKINTVLFQALAPGQMNGTPTSTSATNETNGANSYTSMNNLDINNEIAKEVSDELNNNIISSSNTANITKTINLNTDNTDNLENNGLTNNIIINKEGHTIDNVLQPLEIPITAERNTNKEINIDLHDLDNLDDVNDADPSGDSDMNMDELDLDENCEEIDTDKLVSSKSERHVDEDEIEITKNNLFNLDTINITNAEVFDDLEDTLSIATAPIDETNDVINHNSNFNLDDIQDIDDIDNLDNLEPVNIKSVKLDSTKADDVDLSELLNGNTNKEIKENKDTKENNENNENIKTIDIDTPKTDYNSMSVKQLKDIAKSLGLKATGNKQELVQILLAHEAK